MSSSKHSAFVTRREVALVAAGLATAAGVLSGVARAKTASVSAKGAAADQLPLHARRNTATVGPSQDFHIAGATLEPLLLAEWEADGPMGKTAQIVWGQAAVDKAPATASRYQQKSYSFPTGSIRVLEFRAANGGMLHVITAETAIFLLRGSGTVDVAGRAESIVAGDVVNYPSGVLRGSSDATVIAWTVTGTINNENSRAMVVRRSDAAAMDSAEWDEGGQRVSVRTAAELARAPPDAVRLSVIRYDFPGNSVRVARNFKGGPTSPKTSDLDALIYITSGRMKFTQEGREVEVVAGDAIREIAGASHFWYRLEDSSFVATSSLPLQPLTRGRQ
jgi:quercetin dioxygenase-like cupin family protein